MSQTSRAVGARRTIASPAERCSAGPGKRTLSEELAEAVEAARAIAASAGKEFDDQGAERRFITRSDSVSMHADPVPRLAFHSPELDPIEMWWAISP